MICTFQVVSLPEPVLVTPASSIDDVKYWIIGVVAGGVLIMALIFVLICWRWMKGGPAKKNDVPIDQVDMGPNEMKDVSSFPQYTFFSLTRISNVPERQSNFET